MSNAFSERLDQVSGRFSGRGGTAAKVGIAVVLLYLLVCVVLGWWWNDEPAQFDVRAHAAAEAERLGHTQASGYVATSTVIRLAETLLTKRGGYLSNDLFPPGIWMDNMPNWEFGVLTQIRDSARVFRSDLSRSQSQSAEDPDLAIAEGKFFFDNSSWAFPPSEREYRDGIALFRDYRDRLADPRASGRAQFYARADNLSRWLQSVESRLGSLSQRLSASVGTRGLNLIPQVPENSGWEPDASVRTPWLEIDDVFYEARGQTWALLHILRAIEHDFADVLNDKNARVSLQQIIRELEPTQDRVWSPIILNGDGLGLLANHSLVLASYIARANAAIIDMRALLSQG